MDWKGTERDFKDDSNDSTLSCECTGNHCIYIVSSCLPSLPPSLLYLSLSLFLSFFLHSLLPSFFPLFLSCLPSFLSLFLYFSSFSSLLSSLPSFIPPFLPSFQLSCTYLNIFMKREWLILVGSLRDFVKETVFELRHDCVFSRCLVRIGSGMEKEKWRRCRITDRHGITGWCSVV